MNFELSGKKLFLVSISFLLIAPLIVFAQATELPNPIDASPASGPGATVVDIVFAAFSGFAGIIGLIIFSFIIVNAFKLIVSHGNEESINKAKQGLTWSIAAFLVAIFAFSIISSVSVILEANNQDELGLGRNLSPPIDVGEKGGFDDALKVVINGLLGLVAVAGTLMIVYAGIKMVTANGNEEQITSAKTILKWAILGVVVTVFAFAILNGINLLLGG